MDCARRRIGIHNHVHEVARLILLLLSSVEHALVILEAGVRDDRLQLAVFIVTRANLLRYLVGYGPSKSLKVIR